MTIHKSKKKSKYIKSKKYTKRKRFIPEIEPTLIEYDDKLWKEIFPYKKDLDYSLLQLSNIGKYSITYYDIANDISKIIRNHIHNKKATITDGTSNVGGMIYAFVNDFDKVNAVEIVEYHCNILRNNLKVYNILDKVDIHCVDYLDISNKLSQDVVFFDPPWGGPNYKKQKLLNLYLDNIPISKIIKPLLKKSIVAIKVPFNFDFKTVFELSNKTCVYSFYKPNGRLSFYMIIIEKN